MVRRCLLFLASSVGPLRSTCPPDFLQPWARPSPEFPATIVVTLLTSCLEGKFPISLDQEITLPLTAARALFDKNTGKETEVQQLVDAVFEVVCQRLYTRCFRELATFARTEFFGGEQASSPLTTFAGQLLLGSSNAIRASCDTIDRVLEKSFPKLVGKGGLDLHCGGYFLDATYLRFMLDEYLKANFVTAPHIAQNSSAIVEVLERIGLNTSGFVVNIGAGLMVPWNAGECATDPADCVCFSPYSDFRCILFEGDQHRANELRKRANSSRNIIVVSDYVTPRTIVEVIGAERSKLHGNMGRYFPDLLKLDVDNGDCEFLEEILRVWSPILIDMQVWAYLVPPNLAFSSKFSTQFMQGVKHQYATVFQNMQRGCSLGEVLRIVGNDYRVFKLEGDEVDVQLIHKDFVGYLPDKYRGARDLFQDWEQEFLRHAKYHENTVLGYPFPVIDVVLSNYRDFAGGGAGEIFSYLQHHYRLAQYLLTRNVTLFLGDQSDIWTLDWWLVDPRALETYTV